MRIAPDPTPELLAALARSRQEQQQAILQASSGRRVNAPSDDPSASAAYIQNRARTSEADQFLYSVSTIRLQLQTADGALSSVVTGLQRAITLGVQGANGTNSEAQRQAIAKELRGIRDGILGLANTSFRGSPIFSGTSADTPFALDDSAVGGVRYSGNDTVNDVQVGEGRTICTGIPGDQVFQKPGASVFGALQELIVCLEGAAPTDQIAAANSTLRQAFDHVTAQRSFYGNALNQLDSDETLLNSQKLQLSTEENDLVGADQAESVTKLLNAQNAQAVTLAAIGKISNLSLLDYLK